MDLFDQNYQQALKTQAPLAARMRPQTLDEFVGQNAIIGPGRLLRRAIQADQLSSILFFGPPGTGKTTLAQIIAQSTQAHFIAINAVLTGVKDIRGAIASATDQRKYHQQRTILFVDEVHRFNKSQQDALLPWVENGTIILIGATTENPYFEVNKALVSRSRIFQLKALTNDDLRQIVQQTLKNPERGYGQLDVQLDPDALDHLVHVANGDARSLLNALELAVETTPANDQGAIAITLDVAEESIQQRAVLYDKEGDAHFDTISAFIKSVRGSDPDAALYWLARMIYAGEDPRFILRRLIILASEDIGLADPQAVVVVNACAQAFDRVGMPEGRYPLAQATLYLATTNKSNSVMGFFDALAAVEREHQADVPNHLKDGSRDKKGFGHGTGYLYPHAYRDHWVAQQYLPGRLQGQVFYQPASSGREQTLAAQVARHREAQLAAWWEGDDLAPVETLTFSGSQSGMAPQTLQWLQRSASNVGQQLETLRDRLFELAAPQRHHLILDLNAGSGLLTWEAIRQVPEGGVYSRVNTAKEATALSELATVLPELMRPIIMTNSLLDLSASLRAQAPTLKCDRLIGRNVLLRESDKSHCLKQLIPLLTPEGRVILAETIPRHTQRIYALLDASLVEPELYQRWVNAEEAIYTDPDDPMVNWDSEDLQQAFVEVGFEVQTDLVRSPTEMPITQTLIERWFNPSASNSTRPSYGTHLSAKLKPTEIEMIYSMITQQLGDHTINWQSTTLFITANSDKRIHN